MCPVPVESLLSQKLSISHTCWTRWLVQSSSIITGDWREIWINLLLIRPFARSTCGWCAPLVHAFIAVLFFAIAEMQPVLARAFSPST